MKRISKLANAAWTSAVLTIPTVARAELPQLTVSGVSQTETDPIKYGMGVAAAFFVALVTITIAWFSLTIIKNGWQKYHETGEDGSRTQMKDAALNMAGGTVMLVVALFIAGWGYKAMGVSG